MPAPGLRVTWVRAAGDHCWTSQRWGNSARPGLLGACTWPGWHTCRLLGGRADFLAVVAVPEHPPVGLFCIGPWMCLYRGAWHTARPPARAGPPSISLPPPPPAPGAVRATQREPQQPCLRPPVTQLPACLGMLPGGGWGRGRPTSTESAAPAWPCPLQGKDAGEAGGGDGGVGPPSLGSCQAAGDFLESRPCRSQASWGMRGRTFPEEGLFQTTPKREKGEDRPVPREGSAESAPSPAILPPPIRRWSRQGPLKVREHQCPQAGPSGRPFLRSGPGVKLRSGGGLRPPWPPSLRVLRPSRWAVLPGRRGGGPTGGPATIPSRGCQQQLQGRRGRLRGHLVHPCPGPGRHLDFLREPCGF